MNGKCSYLCELSYRVCLTVRRGAGGEGTTQGKCLNRRGVAYLGGSLGAAAEENHARAGAAERLVRGGGDNIAATVTPAPGSFPSVSKTAVKTTENNRLK